MEIVLDQVCKNIKEAEVLRNISMKLKSGMVYGLCGANGCGKTMLMRAICGFIRPTSGKIYIDQKELGTEGDFVPETGLLLENPVFLNGYSGQENLQILAGIQKKITAENIEAVLARVGLQGNTKKVRKYSLGMKQRLGIAVAIMEKPQLLILDEPTNALDRNGVQMVQQIIAEEKARGALILVACHDDRILQQVSDCIFFMENGEIIRVKEKTSYEK